MDGVKHDIDKWDLLIAHPPCTYLTVSGNRWFNVERYGEKAIQRSRNREDAVAFFMKFINADIQKIAVENPIGCMGTRYRRPDQIVQPYMFGDPVRKATCLWLKGLPLLEPTNMVEPECERAGDGKLYSGAALKPRDENGKILAYNDPRTKVIRSKTYPGLAKAMAEQWG